MDLGFLKGLGAGEISKFLTNAADLTAKDDTTKKKLLVGVILGGLTIGTLVAVRAWRLYQDEHASEIDFIDWVLFKRGKG